MKAITLLQPWASLVAAGYKRIETRGWQTHHRGRIAIHAAASPRAIRTWKGPFLAGRLDSTGEHVLLGAAPDRGPLLLPLGVVVATANLVNCAPIGGPYDFRTGTVEGDEGDFPGQPVIVRHPALGPTGTESLVVDWPDRGVVDVTDQLPYGDFTPGRWGHLYEDIQPMEPVPARGQLGLWNWEPARA